MATVVDGIDIESTDQKLSDVIFSTANSNDSFHTYLQLLPENYIWS